jgi:hypothetical protein
MRLSTDSGTGQLRICFFVLHKSLVPADGAAPAQVNSIVSHPTMPLLITGHEDKYIRIFDIGTGLSFDIPPSFPDELTAFQANVRIPCRLIWTVSLRYRLMRLDFHWCLVVTIAPYASGTSSEQRLAYKRLQVTARRPMKVL